MTWFKDNEPLPNATRYTTNYDLRTDIVILKIDDGRPSDVGNYRVLAENDAGKDETNCYVFVTAVPSIDETPFINPDVFRNLEYSGPRKTNELPEDVALAKNPWLTVKELKDQTCQEGETVSFVCEIKGYPIPDVIDKKIDLIKCFFKYYFIFYI